MAAEAEAQAIMQVQKALADSLKLLNEAAPNDQVVKLKALEAMQKVADGKATKIIIPSELQGLAGLAASATPLPRRKQKRPGHRKINSGGRDFSWGITADCRGSWPSGPG